MYDELIVTAIPLPPYTAGVGGRAGKEGELGEKVFLRSYPAPILLPINLINSSNSSLFFPWCSVSDLSWSLSAEDDQNNEQVGKAARMAIAQAD